MAAIAGAQFVRRLSLCCASWASAARCAEPGWPGSRRQGRGSAVLTWYRCGKVCLGRPGLSLDRAAPLDPAASPGPGAPPTGATLAASSSCRLHLPQWSLSLHSCPAVPAPLRFAGSERGRRGRYFPDLEGGPAARFAPALAGGSSGYRGARCSGLVAAADGLPVAATAERGSTISALRPAAAWASSFPELALEAWREPEVGLPE